MFSFRFKITVSVIFLLWAGISIPFRVLADSQRKSAPLQVNTKPQRIVIKEAPQQNLPKTVKPSLIKKAPPKPKTWNGILSGQKFSTEISDTIRLNTIKRRIKDTLNDLPSEHTEKLKNIEVRDISHPSRGLASSSKIILHMGTIESYKEMDALLKHELGHIVDLGLLQGEHGHETGFHDHKTEILSDDPSLEFYLISWNDTENKVSTATRADFVSGYAMENPFEDFAESYNFYISHGSKFRGLAEKSPILAQKYNFMKTTVFNGQEFERGIIDSTYENMAWDTTLIPTGNPLLAQNN